MADLFAGIDLNVRPLEHGNGNAGFDLNEPPLLFNTSECFEGNHKG